MPVILEREDFDLWLDNDDTDPQDAAALMRPADDDVLEAFEIAPLVNKVANDGPEVQMPVGKRAAAAQGRLL
jgi:putative SOS response-associated peptidase YedK